MSRPTKSQIQTPEEVLEKDIESLERPILHSWGIWAGSLVFAAVLGGLAALALLAPGRHAPRVLSPVDLGEPRGTLEQPPRIFRWSAIPGATSYIVAVTEIGTGEVVLLRPVRDVFVAPSDVEGANFVPGRYAWYVEALGRDGTTVARTDATFAILEPGAS